MPRENHRDRLVRGALRCLRQKGYVATTARDIAAASGAHLGSIAYHFGSKEALLNEALAEGFREWREHVARRVSVPDGGSPLERLRISWRAVLDAYGEHEALLMAFVEALPVAARAPELRQQLAGQYEEGRSAIAAMIEASIMEHRADLGADPKALASLLVAVYDGLLVQWLLDRSSTPTGDELADALESVLQARPGS